MDEDNKKKNDEELKDIENKEEDNKKHGLDPDQLEEMLNEVESRLGLDRSQFKIVRYKPVKPSFKNILLDIIMAMTINVILLLSITGFIKWATYTSLWDLLFYALFFSAIEVLIKYIMFILFRKVLLKAMVLILTLPTLIAIPLSLFLNQSLEITTVVMASVGSTLLMFGVMIIMRNIVNRFIRMRKIRRKTNV
jgi:hypothetical protein